MSLGDGAVEIQVGETVGALRAVLGVDLAGVYLFGSAMLGGLRPRSDVDLFAVSRRRLSQDERRALIDRLLAISGRPRPLEVTLVVQSDVRPWRYPPRRELQYGDWWRCEFEAGQLEPRGSDTDPDLASLVTMVLLANRRLLGAPPDEVLDPVPWDDYVQAMLGAVDGILADLDNDTRNHLLTLARVWSTLATGEVRAKDAAASWALQRLPREHHAVLERAREIYLGAADQGWEDLRAEVSAYAEHVATVSRRIARRSNDKGRG